MRLVGQGGDGEGGGDDFPAAAEAIAALMQPLLRWLETQGAGQLLGARLSAIGFLARHSNRFRFSLT